MIITNEAEEMMKLMQKGFDLDLISFELDIPIEKLQEYKKRLESRQELEKTRKYQKTQKIVKDKNLESNKTQNISLNYEERIKKYKDDIITHPEKAQQKRNLIAFTYFMAGKKDEAKNELLKLIEETNSSMAYRQLIHIEKEEKNYENAKLFAYEALDKFPDCLEIREQLISISKIEKDYDEIKKQLNEIIRINPENRKNKNRLKEIQEEEER